MQWHICIVKGFSSLIQRWVFNNYSHVYTIQLGVGGYQVVFACTHSEGWLICVYCSVKSTPPTSIINEHTLNRLYVSFQGDTKKSSPSCYICTKIGRNRYLLIVWVHIFYVHANMLKMFCFKYAYILRIKNHKQTRHWTSHYVGVSWLIHFFFLCNRIIHLELISNKWMSQFWVPSSWTI